MTKRNRVLRYTFHCEICGEEFKHWHPQSNTCSDKCKKDFRKNYGKRHAAASRFLAQAELREKPKFDESWIAKELSRQRKLWDDQPTVVRKARC